MKNLTKEDVETLKDPEQLTGKYGVQMDFNEPEEDEEGLPVFKQRIELTPVQIDVLKAEVFEALDQLVQERASVSLEEKWEHLEAQYDGEMEENEQTDFNIDLGSTKIKVDACDRFICAAFLEAEPLFTVTPRPESMREGLQKSADRQESYLDYAFDNEIPITNAFKVAEHQASKLGTGLIKIPYSFRIARRKRTERYTADKSGQKIFQENYPEATKEGAKNYKFWKRLLKNDGEEIQIEVDFNEIIYDNPEPQAIDIKDFLVPLKTNGYEGLCRTKTTIERQSYKFWELKQKEADGDFENVDELMFQPGESREKKSNFDCKDYTILEVTHIFNFESTLEAKDFDPENEEKIICWFDQESKIFLGAIYYPYHGIDSIYVPLNIKKKTNDFYQCGLAEDLTGTHLAENVALNLLLTAGLRNNVDTPVIREGSDIQDSMIDGKLESGKPIIVRARGQVPLLNDIAMLPKDRANSPELMQIMQFLKLIDDDKTAILSNLSGKESPTDPRAPAAKTAMLLQQAGINVKDYIKTLLPGFNKIGEICLQQIYQMSRGERKFTRKRAVKVTGGDPFETISREEMIAKTNIMSNASGFAFDKAMEKQENLQLFQILRQDPYVMSQPKVVHELARELVRSWSPNWKNKVDSILLSPEDFDLKLKQTAVMAISAYLQNLEKVKEQGGSVEPNVRDLMQMVAQLQSAEMTPPEEGENEQKSA